MDMKGSPLSVEQYKDIRNIPVEDIYNNLVKGSTPVFLPWGSMDNSLLFSMSYILNMNNNDCSIPRDIIKKIKNRKINEKGESKFNYNEGLIKHSRVIAEGIVRCWKQKKVIALPVYFISGLKKSSGAHANILIFNTWLGKAEHLEPHGRKFAGGPGKWTSGKAGWIYRPDGVKEWGFTERPNWISKTLPGINLKTGVTAINKELKYMGSKLKFEYLKPADTCPKEPGLFRGVQSRDQSVPDITLNELPYNIKGKIVNSRMFQGVVITEKGGYCGMWSLFLLDIRLKTLKTPVEEVITKLSKLQFNDYGSSSRPKEYINLMRGSTAFAFNSQLQMIEKGLISRLDLITALGNTYTEPHGTFKPNASSIKKREALKKYNIAVEEYLTPIWEKFTSE